MRIETERRNPCRHMAVCAAALRKRRGTSVCSGGMVSVDCFKLTGATVCVPLCIVFAWSTGGWFLSWIHPCMLAGDSGCVIDISRVHIGAKAAPSRMMCIYEQYTLHETRYASTQTNNPMHVQRFDKRLCSNNSVRCALRVVAAPPFLLNVRATAGRLTFSVSPRSSATPTASGPSSGVPTSKMSSKRSTTGRCECAPGSREGCAPSNATGGVPACGSSAATRFLLRGFLVRAGASSLGRRDMAATHRPRRSLWREVLLYA